MSQRAHAHPCSCESRLPRQAEHTAKPPLGFDRGLLLFPAGHIKTDVLHQGPEVVQVVLRKGQDEGIAREGEPPQQTLNGPSCSSPSTRKADAERVGFFVEIRLERGGGGG